MTYNIVKHSYIKQSAGAIGRALAHARYIQHRPGKDIDGVRYREFFNDTDGPIDFGIVRKHIAEQPDLGVLIHKMILAPAAADANLQEFTREVMHELGRKKALDLQWFAVEHYNTAHPHCHVIILGRDKNQRLVRFNKDDYAAARKAGDEYLRRNRLIPDKRTRTKRSRVRNLLSRMCEAGRVILRVFISKEEYGERVTLRLADLASESDPLGSLPMPERTPARLDRRKRRQQREFQKPIVVTYGDHPEEKIVYTSRSHLAALRELEQDYHAADPFVRASVSEAQLFKLQSWIKEAWRQQKQTKELAKQITRFELELPDGKTITLDRSSKPSHLRDLINMHERGEAHLHDAEVEALKTWHAEATKRTPDRHRDDRDLP